MEHKELQYQTVLGLHLQMKIYVIIEMLLK